MRRKEPREAERGVFKNEERRDERMKEENRGFGPKRGFNQRWGWGEGCLTVAFERRTPPTDALLKNVFVQQARTHTRLLLDCGSSGFYPAKPPQANAVHSDMEIFYWAFLWCMNSPEIPWIPKENNLKLNNILNNTLSLMQKCCFYRKLTIERSLSSSLNRSPPTTITVSALFRHPPTSSCQNVFIATLNLFIALLYFYLN